MRWPQQSLCDNFRLGIRILVLSLDHDGFDSVGAVNAPSGERFHYLAASYAVL